jgi:hypothetical protein
MEQTKLPSYLSSSEHIELDMDEEGIKVNFAKGRVSACFAASEICEVFGAFQVPRRELETFGGRPIAHVSVSLTYQPTGEIRSLLVLDERGITLDDGGQPVGDDIASVGGYFTIDLRQSMGGTVRLGKYWVLFQLGPYVSKVLELEILDPRDCIVKYDLFTGKPIPPKADSGGDDSDEDEDEFDADDEMPLFFGPLSKLVGDGLQGAML